MLESNEMRGNCRRCKSGRRVPVVLLRGRTVFGRINDGGFAVGQFRKWKISKGKSR